MTFAHLLATVSLLSIASLSHASPQYSLTALSPLAGYPGSFAAALNHHGQIVGYGDLETYPLKTLATSWANGTASALTDGQGRYSAAFSINDHGQVVGVSYTRSGFYEPTIGGLETIPSSPSYDGQATLWQNSTATTLPGLSGQYAQAKGINNLGQVVGWSLGADNQITATLWSNNLPTALTSLDGYRGEANAINDQGNIVGSLSKVFGDYAALWNNNNELTLLNTIGGIGAEAYAINSNNLIIGWSASADGKQHATLWDNGTAIDLGRPDDYASFAYGLNNLGHVVGSFIGIDGTTGYLEEYAALWIDGSRINLNSLIDSASGIMLDSAYGINDQGWIIARGLDSNDNYNAYLLMPVPEPSSYAMLLAGLGLLVRSARRKTPSVG
ncbi:PEP-CTERM sorting domain-containing protein [Methylobacillus sp. Pita1]|uniref:PEP-CTERM sorting domain-containing protein n=1 Tax=Methylobacillus sp. Pita1 TaxID=3382642 RepID=UPI0038B56F52